MQAAALDVLQNTEVIGGDLLMKRAHQNSSSNHPLTAPAPDPGNGDPGPTGTDTRPSAAEQLAVMSGDLSVAQDYENYLNNREAINALMAANPNSAFTAGWIATFARVNELGLNHANASDFLGGLAGFLDSVSKAGLGAAAANATVKLSGGTATVDVKVANGTDVPGSLSVFADSMSQSSDATGTTVHFTFANAFAAGGAITGRRRPPWTAPGSGRSPAAPATICGSAATTSATATMTTTRGRATTSWSAARRTTSSTPATALISSMAAPATTGSLALTATTSCIGGKGNDALYGGAGNDTYVFNRGDGPDWVY